MGRYCSLIPGFGVKLSVIILAGPTVLSAVDLAGSMASGCQSDISANTSRSLEAGRIVNRRLETERGDRAIECAICWMCLQVPSLRAINLKSLDAEQWLPPCSARV
jgi:hypothetical protein